jgi:effector-binding domain-containing protein
MSDDLLSIGSFGRRCRLSVKALRHYDEVGLLRPIHVDLATGYRYYHRHQAPAAIAIAMLRSLDVPIAAIRYLLASEDGGAITRILDRERARQAREIERASSALRSIERLVRAGTVFPYDVAVAEVPGETLLYVEGTTTSELHVEAGTALVHDLLGRLRELGRPQIGPVQCVMPRSGDDETLILQMGTAIADAPPDVPVLTLPAGTVAVTQHVGPYEEIGLAEHALYAWAEERGVEVRGPIREIYRNDPATVPPELLETDVLLPITRPSGRTPQTAAARR